MDIPTSFIPYRSHLAHNHLHSSIFFAEKCGEIETNGFQHETVLRGLDSTKGESINVVRLEHQSYAISSVLAAVAFLEAEINSLFADSAEATYRIVRPLEPNKPSDETLTRWAAIWNIDSVRKKASILEKYQLALRLAQVGEFDAGQQPYQDAKLLIGLRNALVHFVPETTALIDEAGAVEPQDLEKKLRGKFAPNPFFGHISLTLGSAAVPEKGIPATDDLTVTYLKNYFPEECLGHGCSEWAFNTAVKFADAFYGKLGLSGTYQFVQSVIAYSHI